MIGLSLGVLGGGGSILTVPLLVYVAGQDPATAIATSLLVVGATSAIGAVGHARSGNVAWRTAVLFGAAGMVGAYPGGRLGAVLPGTLLLVAFAVLLVVTAVAMLRPSGVHAPATRDRLPVGRVILHGLVVGGVTGVVGAGGGFLVVPALVVLGGVQMHVAVGSSLVVIAMKSAGGLAGYAAGVELDWPLALAVTGAAAAGSLLGGRFADRIDASMLRRGFGWFVLAVGQLVLLAEASAAMRPWAALVAVVATTAVVMVVRTGDAPATDAATATSDATPDPKRSSL